MDDFNKIELKVGKIVSAESIEEADSLLKLQVDTGEKIIQIFAGIKKAYEPQILIGKLIVYVANLKPRKMRFGISEGMILAASFDKNKICLIHPDEDAKVGMRVK
jgi:methionyl-tRNA synthetase